jgi:hypothetical protein
MHTGYIDQIVLGPGLAAARLPGSFQRLGYAVRDAARLKLSDHCPIAVHIAVESPRH